jgi:imidazolonepropionase-like amidohydrolase
MPRAMVVVPALSLIMAACATTASQGPAPIAAGIALSHVTVVDVESGRLLPDQTVLVRGSRIVDISPAAGAELPRGTTVIDGRGKYLIPGLWDMHVHSAVGARDEFPVYVALGVTGVRNMHTTVDTALELIGSIRRQVAAGTLLGPRFVANGALVDGPRPAQPGSIPIGTPAAAGRIIDSLARGGAEFVKVYNLLPRDVYFAVLEAAKARGLAVAGHIPVTVRAEEAAAAGQRSVEHVDGLDYACSTGEDSIRANFLARPSREAWKRANDALTATWSAEQCSAAIAAYARHGTWSVPTLAVAWAEAAGDSMLLDDAAMATLPAAVADRWRAMAADTTHAPDPFARARLGHSIATVRLLHQAGVPILAGTDVGNPFVVPGWSLHRELELLVEAGLSPLEALRAATLNPAIYLEATDSLGTIAAGKLADLVLLEANPLDDIRNTRRIRAVIINGRYLDRQALDTLVGRP